MTTPPPRIGVIGSGVAGLTAAYVTSRTAHVTLFEADDRLGGHADTHVVAAPVPGPLRVVQWVERAGADRMHETCRVWDPAGRLVGHAHQLAAIRR